MSEPKGKSSAGMLVLRIAIAVCLVVDAVVHLQLAGNYDRAASGGIGAGNLFRIEAAAAILVALYVLLSGSRWSYGAAAVVALSAFVAVVLYRYVDVPAIGPIPSMYEPIWFPQKTLTAVAEGLGGVLAVYGLAVLGRRSGRRKSRRP